MCLVRCHAHDPLGGGAGSYWLARPYNVICSRVSREEVVLIISHICNCMTVSLSVVCNFVTVQSLTLQVFLIVFEFLCQIFAKALQGKFNTGRQIMIAFMVQHDQGLHDKQFCGHLGPILPQQAVNLSHFFIFFCICPSSWSPE